MPSELQRACQDLMQDRSPSAASVLSINSDALFPSRAVILPDELRGALLLPSESEDMSSTTQSLSALVARTQSPGGSDLQSFSIDRPSRSPSPFDLPSVGLPVGLAELEEAQLNDSFARSSRSKDWSLSDADLQELLAQGLSEFGLADRPASQALDRPQCETADLWESGSAASAMTWAEHQFGRKDVSRAGLVAGRMEQGQTTAVLR
eukprot:TRINITY_DN53630_c0_g1_i1.p1 TRINITY_DN53630_c0_g1~~TRINITY_DN53630_c0_g1_i1.p1  ORF type:complete len:207 (+),score=38.02 TRINITY_DN53630_c0_g1_i1:38-658(+)